MDISLYYQEKGEGEPIFLLHGNGEDGANIAMKFALKSEAAKRSMEVLGLMIHEPNIKPAELRSIHIPTLVIAGTRDMIKEEHTRLIANEIPDAKLVIMRGNHFIANKKADRFNQEAETFLQSIQ